MKSKNSVHKTAIIDQNVKIGINTKVWHWTHVCKNVTIGNNVTIGQNVFIGENVKIGSNVKIQNNVSIFEGVELQDYVFCGPSVTFTNVQLPRSEFPIKNKQKFYKKTLVKKYVSIGANSTIICGVILNDFSFIGAGSVVTKNVNNYSLVMGVPAKHKGWVSRSGHKLKFSLNSNLAKCPQTLEKYKLLKDKCTLIK